MIKIFGNKWHIVFAFLFLMSILPFFGIFFQNERKIEAYDEMFKPELSHLNNTAKVIEYVDSLYQLKAGSVFDTAVFVKIVSETIKQRFAYGLVHYSFSENWIASLAGKLFWSHLSAIVDPNDILKHPQGLCSQQTIVFMEVLKQKHINVRSVGLGKKEGPGHFLCEVHYNGSWRLHDVTKEPYWVRIVNDHESMNYYLAHKDSLFLVYNGRINEKLLFKILERVEYGKVNEFPAKNMLVFHTATLMLAYIIPVMFFIMFIISSLKFFRSQYEKRIYLDE